MGQLKIKKEKELCNVNGNGKQLLMEVFYAQIRHKMQTLSII